MIRHLRKYTIPKSDPLQFGNKKGISTKDMLVKLLHIWHTAIDNGDSVRVVFLDYSKAFDRVNHNILLEKLKGYDIPQFLTRWFSSFLTRRSQYVRLGDFLSDILFLNGAVPQCAIFGMEGFLALIDDLKPALPLFKYVDDSTAFEIVRKSDPDSQKSRSKLTKRQNGHTQTI